MALKRVRVSEVDTSFRNPDKGWLAYSFVPYTNPANVHMSAYVSSVFCHRFPWSRLEPSEGTYDWSQVDALIDAWKGTSRVLRFGVAYAFPPENMEGGVECYPAWIRALPGGGYFEPSLAPTTWQPDYRNATYQTKLSTFITALATRYYKSSGFAAGENDWRQWIVSINLTAFGLYGEWHSASYPWANVTEQKNTLRALVDIYYNAFNGARGSDPLPVFTMNVMGKNACTFDVPLTDPTDSMATRYAVETLGAHMVRRNFGLDWGQTFWDDEPPYLATHVANRRFQAEWGPSHSNNTWYFKPSGESLHYTEEVVELALTRKASMMGWYLVGENFTCSGVEAGLDLAKVPQAAQCTLYGGAQSGSLGFLQPAAIQALTHSVTGETLEVYFQRRSGYRFHVPYHHFPESVAAGSTFRLTQRWYQRAVAKLYKQHYIRARLVGAATVTLDRDTSSFTAHNWEVGAVGPRLVVSTFTVPGGTAAGAYELQFAVVDTAGSPAMNLASIGKVTAGLADSVNDYSWYAVGTIRVT